MIIQPNGDSLILFANGRQYQGLPLPGGGWLAPDVGINVGKPTLRVSGVTHAGATLTATKGEGLTPTGFTIQVSREPEFIAPIISNSNPFTPNNLNSDTQYYARALARLEDFKSVWSDTVGFKTLVAPVATGFAWPFPPDDIGTEWEGYPGHKGVDWPRAGGTPIKCANAGTVEMAGWTGTEGDFNSGWGWGYKVVVNHGAIGQGGAVLRTLYAHMNSQPPVSVGQVVAKGQTLGYVGTTGISSGNHLHWETSVGSMYNQINPRVFMATYGE